MCTVQVAKPPGPHDNKLSMFKPIPPLAPLPERHTLDVRRPHVIRASAFADLKSIPLTILALVTRVVRRDTQETRVKIDVKPPTPKEPWSLPKSIFKPRTRESDAKNFWDTPKVRLRRGKARNEGPTWLLVAGIFQRCWLCCLRRVPPRSWSAEVL